MMGTAKALRQVELLARIIVARLEHSEMIGVCDSECTEQADCDAHHTGKLKCEKCGEEVPYDFFCDETLNLDVTCNNDVALELADEDQALLRDLRLALVQLDIARSEEMPSIYERP